MFTGLIQSVGAVVAVHKDLQEMDLEVDLGQPAELLGIGASVALSGVCCTATSVDGTAARFRLSEETLRRTWFGALEPGARLNVEAALRAGDPLGGHLVQGHVDGVGRIVVPVDPRDGGELWVELDEELLRYCVEKGSIAIDGVSLTVAAVDGRRVMIAIIPHTAQATTLGAAAVGQSVNIEVDILAKYVEKMLEGRLPPR